MNEYTFHAITAAEATDAQTDALFERFEGDATPGAHNGTPHVGFVIEAHSLEEAMRTASSALREIGLPALHFEVAPAALQAA